MAKMKIKAGDTVILLTGDYKDKYEKNGDRKTGKVVAVSPEEGKVIVGGINQVSKHVKPKKQGDQGGIVTTEGAIYASKVQLYCGNCKKGVRAGYKMDGDKKVRICKKCGKEI